MMSGAPVKRAAAAAKCAGARSCDRGSYPTRIGGCPFMLAITVPLTDRCRGPRLVAECPPAGASKASGAGGRPARPTTERVDHLKPSPRGQTPSSALNKALAIKTLQRPRSRRQRGQTPSSALNKSRACAGSAAALESRRLPVWRVLAEVEGLTQTQGVCHDMSLANQLGDVGREHVVHDACVGAACLPGQRPTDGGGSPTSEPPGAPRSAPVP